MVYRNEIPFLLFMVCAWVHVVWLCTVAQEMIQFHITNWTLVGMCANLADVIKECKALIIYVSFNTILVGDTTPSAPPFMKCPVTFFPEVRFLF